MKALSFVLHFAIIPAVALSQNDLLRQTDSLIQTGIEQTIRQEYREAEATFTIVKAQTPKHPAGYLFHAAALQTQMMDFDRYDREAHFIALIDTTILLAQSMIREDTDGWAYFYLGSAYGYRAFHLSKQEKWWQAFQNGKLSVQNLETAVAIDSTIYDAYLGIGTYKYYRSKLSRHFAWLPFIRDERTEGIAMVKKSLRKSRYSRYSSANAICWILLEEKRYQEALKIVEAQLLQFPDTRFFLWCAAKLNKQIGALQTAISYYKKILSTLAETDIHSPYIELTGMKNLIRLYQRTGQQMKIKRLCNENAELRLSKTDSQRYSKVRKQIAELCKENVSSE